MPFFGRRKTTAPSGVRPGEIVETPDGAARYIGMTNGFALVRTPGGIASLYCPDDISRASYDVILVYRRLHRAPGDPLPSADQEEQLNRMLTRRFNHAAGRR